MSNLIRRLRLFLNRDSATRDMQEEMRMHVELRAEQLQTAGNTNASGDAHRMFGNRTQKAEEARSASGLGWLEHVMLDVRYAARRIKQKPAFAAAVICVMSLGIGATTAMFSAVDAAMLRPLPFAKPSELVWLRSIAVPFDPGSGVHEGPFHRLSVLDVDAMKDLFVQSASYAAGGLNVSDEDHPVRANAGVVTAGFFATLGVYPAQGRMFAPEEGKPGAAPVVIVSHKFWQQHLGERNITGATLSLNGTRYQVVGVMPRGFGFPRESDLWIPMSVPTTFATYGAFRGFLNSETIARLAANVSPGKAEAQMMARWQQSLMPGVTKNDPNVTEILEELRTKHSLLPFQQRLVGDKRTALLILLGATAILLLIACANVTNLLLSQASIRMREMALREVLGATRARIVRQLLVESTMLAFVGAALGVALAPAALTLINRLMPPALIGLAPARVDLRVLGFAVALALATGIVFGLWPALGTSRSAPDAVIKSGSSHGSTAGKLGRGRRLLVAAELSLTIVLLVGAGLMLRSFRHVMGLDAGMSTARVATLELSFRSMPPPERMRRLDDIVAAAALTPGVAAVGLVNDLPLRGGGGISVTVDVPNAPKKEMMFARLLMASPGYFDALGIRLIDGRNFTARDDSLAPKVMIISESMAKEFWPGVNPIGRTINAMPGKAGATVIGIAADVRETSLEREPGSQMYFPIAQQTPGNVAIVARGTLPPAQLLASLARAVRSADRSQAVYNAKMMDEVVDASVAPRKTNLLLITIFAGVALALSALGVYAVVAYGVAQRGRELGIRAALGAGAGNLMTLVAGELMWVSILGIVAGLGGAWALSKLVSSMLYGISPHDPATYALVPLALLLPAAVAAIIPAHRASQVDPAIILRND